MMEILGLFSILGTLVFAVIWILLWWVIFNKAGFSYSLLLAILMGIPIINIVIFLVFTFGEWPALNIKK